MYQGKVLLIVNVASLGDNVCQYKDFNTLLKNYGKRGLRILAFPSNTFKQEPRNGFGIHDHIRLRLEKKCGVIDWTPHEYLHFFKKGRVNGPQTISLYKQLKESCPLESDLDSSEERESKIRWNFEKFLIARNGSVRYRFSPDAWDGGDYLTYNIKSLLDEPNPFVEYLD
jgi:glutathione peroxidase